MFSLIEALPMAIAVLDETGTVVAWNPAASSLYGWPADEVIKDTWQRFVHDDDGDEFEAVLQAARSGGRWEGNFRVRRRDGVLLVSSFLATTMVGPEGDRLFAWIGTDATDQSFAEGERAILLSAERAARDELAASLGVVEALLDSAPLGMAIFDLELCCTHTNATFVRMIHAEADPTGVFLDDIATLPPEVAADLRRVATTGRAVLDRTVELSDADGTLISANYFPIFAQGRPTGAGLTWTDMTAARRAETERVALTKRADTARRRLAVLASASSVLTTSSSVDALLERLVRVLAPAAADWCVIELLDRAGRVEHAAVAHADRDRARRRRAALLEAPTDRRDDSPEGRVLRTGQAVLLVDTELDGEDRASSTIVVPIKTRGELLGLLRLSNESGLVLDEDDLDLAVEIAHRAALAVGRAITYRNEHLLAEALQQALLPASVPSLPDVPIEVRYAAAVDGATVGGDWYDAFELPGSKLLLSIGDVIGHDMTAAVGMSRLRYLINAFTIEEAQTSGDGWPDLSRVLARIERLITTDPSAWASCILAVLDVTSGELRWNNAGHPDPLLVRAGHVTPLEGNGGTLLGVREHGSHRTATTWLSTGDRVLLYTDGLVERRNENLTIGEVRLVETVRHFGTAGLSRFCDELMAAMFRTAERRDDVALLAFDYVTA